MKYSHFFLVCLTLSSISCSSNMTGDLERRHVHNGNEKSGTVVYNPHGLESIVADRRALAVGRIHDYCQPDMFKITKEEVVSPQERDPNYDGPANKLNIKTLMFMDFVCVQTVETTPNK